MKPTQRFNTAAMVALARSQGKSLHGAVALRADGKLVYAHNGIGHHCEARLCRKVTPGSTVWLVRVTREGKWADSTPCKRCMARLQAAQVDVVYFTTGPTTYAKVRFYRKAPRRRYTVTDADLPPSDGKGLEAWLSPSSAVPRTLWGLDRTGKAMPHQPTAHRDDFLLP